jgi:hypothetical protein
MFVVAHVLQLFILIFSRIKDMSTRYRDNLQLVLKDLTIDIQPGEKVRNVVEIVCI